MVCLSCIVVVVPRSQHKIAHGGPACDRVATTSEPARVTDVTDLTPVLVANEQPTECQYRGDNYLLSKVENKF